MINSYNDDFGVGVGAGGFTEIFMSKNDRHPNRMLSGFVVGSQDTNSLVDHIKNHGDQSNLYLHLGYLGNAPLPLNDWFNFRFILQINGTGNEAGQAFYYEFSRPCPPSCGGGYEEKPLENTLEQKK